MEVSLLVPSIRNDGIITSAFGEASISCSEYFSGKSLTSSSESLSNIGVNPAIKSDTSWRGAGKLEIGRSVADF
jgi:hypothetical protein